MSRQIVILNGTYKGKKITVTKYNKHAAGLEIKIEHDATAAAGKQLRWCQTIAENGSFIKACKRQHYVDPFGPSGATDASGRAICTGDDNKPFYWTDAEFTGGQGPFFYDKPSESPPAKGRTWIQFTTSLVEVSGTDVVILGTLAWGFDRMADGQVLAAAVRRASADELKNHLNGLKSSFASHTFSLAK